MDTQRIAEPETKFIRKIPDSIFSYVCEDLQVCKYLKVEAGEAQRVEKTCLLPGSDRLSRKVLVRQAALNFQNSGVPLRFMYYDKGRWRDYSQDVSSIIMKGFMTRASSANFYLKEKMYVVNFVYMVQLNVSTGYARSIAWIDDNGKFFAPSKLIERRCAEWPSCHRREKLEDPKCDFTLANAIISAPSDRTSTIADASENSYLNFANLGDKLIKVVEGDQDFAFVTNKFLSGFSIFAKDTTITGIFRNAHNGISGQARLQSFKIQEKITAEVRGNANVQYAWHGTSKDAVSGVILHGFGQPRVPKNGVAFGVGVYLAPEDSSHVSAVYSDVDENGEQHMVLCQAVMGRMEQVHAGSQQFHPSNEDYDTGVDDLSNPKRHIIWSTHMNTHILPLFVISFKLAPSSRDVIIAAQRGKQALRESLKIQRHPVSYNQAANEPWNSTVTTINAQGAQEDCQPPEYSFPVKHAESCSSDCVTEACTTKLAQNQFEPIVSGCSVPRSPWISFPDLFPLLESKLEPPEMKVLQQLHLKFQVGKLPRNLFVKMIRRIFGDEFLRDCIKNQSVQAKSNNSAHSFCG